MADISWKLTGSLSFDFPGRDREDREYLSHDLHKYFCHFRSERNLSINPQTLEEALDVLKQFDERIVTRSHVFCSLYNVGVKRGP